MNKKTQAINKAVNKCINAHPHMQKFNCFDICGMKNAVLNILLTQYVKVTSGIALPGHNTL